MKKGNLSKEQERLVKDFISTTQSSERQAITYLSDAKWNIQNAINNFFDSGVMPQREVVQSHPNLQIIFAQYSHPSHKNQNVKYMDEEHFSNFNDKYMQIADDNVVLGYILLNIMGVQTSGHIEKHHFLKLFQHLAYIMINTRINDPKELKKNIPRLQKELGNDKNQYSQMYIKLYKFYLIGNKEVSLDFQIAFQLWKVYLKPIMPLYNKFIDYLSQLTKKPHKVHLDLWKMVYQFATTVNDVNNINQSDGWPVFLDDFAEYCKQ